MYLEETVERGQYNRHGQILRVDEVEGLGHRDEHLVVHTVRNPLFFHPLGDGERITLFNVLLAEQNSWQEPDAKLDLFGTSKREAADGRDTWQKERVCELRKWRDAESITGMEFAKTRYRGV